MKIKSKNGVYIDDLSDWGENLVKDNHPGEMPQLEALLEEGFYKMKGEAKAYLEKGKPKIEKTDYGTIEWKVIELEEVVEALRKI